MTLRISGNQHKWLSITVCHFTECHYAECRCAECCGPRLSTCTIKDDLEKCFSKSNIWFHFRTVLSRPLQKLIFHEQYRTCLFHYQNRVTYTVKLQPFNDIDIMILWWTYNLWSSYDHLMIILWSSYDHLMIILWSSYDHPMIILWSSYDHPMIILWSSYDHLMIILWSSYDHLMIILW